MSKEKFNYCIAHSWPDTEHVGLYRFGNVNWYGTLCEAEEMRELVQSRDKGHVYFVCRISPVGDL